MNKEYYEDSETHKDERGKKTAGLAGVWNTAFETKDPHLLLALGNSALRPSYTLVYELQPE